MLPTPLGGSQVVAMAGITPGNSGQEKGTGQNIPSNPELCVDWSLPPPPPLAEGAPDTHLPGHGGRVGPG